MKRTGREPTPQSQRAALRGAAQRASRRRVAGAAERRGLAPARAAASVRTVAMVAARGDRGAPVPTAAASPRARATDRAFLRTAARCRGFRSAHAARLRAPVAYSYHDSQGRAAGQGNTD